MPAIEKGKRKSRGLRRFRETCSLQRKCDPKEISYELGHSGIQITLDLCEHLFHDAERAKPRLHGWETIAMNDGCSWRLLWRHRHLN